MSTCLRHASTTTKTIASGIFFGMTILLCVGNTFALESQSKPTSTSSDDHLRQGKRDAKNAAKIVEVNKRAGNYTVTIDGKQTYVGTSFWGAMATAAGNGTEGDRRVINVRASGRTTAPIQLYANTTLNWRSRHSWDSHVKRNGSRAARGVTIFATGAPGIRINGLKMTTTAKKGPAYGIRLTQCPGARIENVFMDWKGTGVKVGIRVDSGWPKFTKKVEGVVIKNVHIRNMKSGDYPREEGDYQGVETFGINNVDIDNIEGRNLGGCALLVQGGSGGRIGTVKGVRCGNGSGYATLRFANKYSDCVVDKVISDGQYVGGRGLFIKNSSNITVKSVEIRNAAAQGIFIQHAKGNKVLSGTVRNSQVRLSDAPESKFNVKLVNSPTMVEGRSGVPLPR